MFFFKKCLTFEDMVAVGDHERGLSVLVGDGNLKSPGRSSLEDHAFAEFFHGLVRRLRRFVEQRRHFS